MAFTYDLTTSLGKVRMELGDSVDASASPGSGVRPNGANFTDAEITYFLTLEGDSVMKATAAACETLSRQWTAAVSITVGPRSEGFDTVAAKWAAQAAALRASYGVTRTDTDPLNLVIDFARNDPYNPVT